MKITTVLCATLLTSAVATPAVLANQHTDKPAQRDVYYGAVHVHTNYSFDAFTNGTLTTPADAYKWAQGEAVPGGGGGPDLKINTPLDFYAVSDHAEWMGVFKEMANPDSPLSKHPMAARITSDDTNTAMQAFAEILIEKKIKGSPSNARTCCRIYVDPSYF